MSRVLAIGWVNLKRMLRDRSNIFFVFIFPLALIFLIGSQFGGDATTARVGVSGDGELADRIADRLDVDEDITVSRFATTDSLIEAIEGGSVLAGLDLPTDLDQQVADGETVDAGFLTRPEEAGGLEPVVSSAVSEITGEIRLARSVSGALGLTEAKAEEALGQTDVAVSPVVTETTGDPLFAEGTSAIAVGASGQLVLFTFLTAVAGSVLIIQSRQLGVTTRMLSTPTSTGQVVAGESIGRFLIALFQGVYIMVMTAVIFGVDWGNLPAAAILLLALSLAGAGAGMLFGTLFSNDQQASGIGVTLSLVLAALGGCMFPLQLFPDTMRTIARFTPHAWAVEGFDELTNRGGSLADVAPEVGVLVAFGAVLLALASRRLRTVISS